MSQTPPPNKSKPIFKRTSVIVAIITTVGAIITTIIGGIFLQVSASRGAMTSPSPSSVTTATTISTATHPTPTPPSLPALVQHPPLYSQSTNIDKVPFSQPVKAGDLIIVAITQWIGGVSNVSDDQGDIYTPVVTEAPYATPYMSPDSTDHKNHDYAELYYAENVMGGTTTVTVTFMAIGDTNLGIYEFSGLDKAALLDSNEVVSKTGTSQNPNGGILKTTTDNELCFVVGVDDDGNSNKPMPGNQYSSLEDHQDDANDERFYTEYRIGQRGSYLTDFSIATESHWAVVGAAFKP